MWEQILANRRRSRVLIGTMGTILALLGYCGGEMLIGPGGGVIGAGVALVILLIQLAVYFGGAEQLLLGDASTSEVTREANPRLYNIVEEMKLASGLPAMPKIYVIDDPAPNAFAFGRSPETNGVAVTSGLMQRLNRDELQGVIAHEMAHLNNRDTKFMMLAAVMLGSIAVLAEIISRSARLGSRSRSRSESRGEGQAAAIIMIVGLLLAILGPLMARLLYFACSRKREFLADACAAQFTRYPEGLASALQKISAGSAAVAFANQANTPMFIISPLQASSEDGGDWLSTHPSTSERIRILRSMGAASLKDYQAAYQQVHGGNLIGSQSLAADQAQPVRDASGEGAVWSRSEARSTTQRAAGFLRVHCTCGLDIGVPAGYEQRQIRCVRCGSIWPVPSAHPESQPNAAPAESQALQYQRRGGGWEGFRCACGQTIQISPMFSGNHTTCSRCHRNIEILPVPPQVEAKSRF